MKNKKIAWYGILSYLVCGIGFVISGNNPSDGLGMFLAYGGLVSWLVLGIYGWVRLIKSND